MHVTVLNFFEFTLQTCQTMCNMQARESRTWKPGAGSPAVVILHRGGHRKVYMGSCGNEVGNSRVGHPW